MIPKVEVIIATTASAERRVSLSEAIDSIINQAGVYAIPSVILNGATYDPELFEYLKARSDIKLHYEKEGSLPKAIEIGRSLVESEFFGFLDDDDILLDNALALRVEMFRRYPETDVVVGNGYVDNFGKGVLLRDSFADCREDPLISLMDSNWLASCGGLFKSTVIGQSYFSDLPKYFEWTWVAYNLVLNGKLLQFVDEPTFQVRNSNDSLSKEEGNIAAMITLVTKMHERADHHHIQRKLKKRLGTAYHTASQRALRDGLIGDAWAYHIRSLNTLGNLGYLSFTRHLLWPFAKNTWD